MSQNPISELRRHMLKDMAVRKFTRRPAPLYARLFGGLLAMGAQNTSGRA